MNLLTWLMDEAKGEEATDWYLTSRMLAINFAAIHSSSMVGCNHDYVQISSFLIRRRLSHMQFIIWPLIQNT